MIPYGRQELSQADIDAVVAVLRSDFLTQGPAIPRFEEAIAEYCGCEHAVAMSNGTAALHAACHAAGLTDGGLLWTSPITFVASANCGRYCGADVDFVDIDPRTLTMSAEALEEKLARAESAGRLPDVVVTVDFGGLPAPMERIGELASRYGFRVIEDAAHSLGADCGGTKVGGVPAADMTMFSFHPVKGITTGEGGMVVTDDEQLARRLALFRTHGISRDPAEMVAASEGGWYYEQLELGFNYRMTDIQAALGTSQLSRLDDFVSRRDERAERYRRALEGLPLRWQAGRAGDSSAWHLFVVVLEDASKRRQVYDSMRAAGIGVNVHYIPVHLQPYYRELGFRPGDYPVAEAYYAGALTLPLYPGLTEADQDTVLTALRRALEP